MAFGLKNSLGLFLMTMGATRNDHSFTKNEELAVKFEQRSDAEARQKKLLIMNLKIVAIDTAAKHLTQFFWLTFFTIHALLTNIPIFKAKQERQKLQVMGFYVSIASAVPLF